MNFEDAQNRMTFADIELSTKFKYNEAKHIDKFVNTHFNNYVFRIFDNEFSTTFHLTELDTGIKSMMKISSNIKKRKVCLLQIGNTWAEQEFRRKESYSSIFEQLLSIVQEAYNHNTLCKTTLTKGTSHSMMHTSN